MVETVSGTLIFLRVQRQLWPWILNPLETSSIKKTNTLKPQDVFLLTGLPGPKISRVKNIVVDLRHIYCAIIVRSDHVCSCVTAASWNHPFGIEYLSPGLVSEPCFGTRIGFSWAVILNVRCTILNTDTMSTQSPAVTGFSGHCNHIQVYSTQVCICIYIDIYTCMQYASAYIHMIIYRNKCILINTSICTSIHVLHIHPVL